MRNFKPGSDEKRIADILAPGEKIEKLPYVSRKMLEKYYRYLFQKLPSGLLLTGQETLGYFRWEEKFDFGYGSKKEYEQLKKQNASCYDQFKLISLKGIDSMSGILASVLRVSDRKKFTIPLENLEACDKGSDEYVLLQDYSIWLVNYKGRRL